MSQQKRNEPLRPLLSCSERSEFGYGPELLSYDPAYSYRVSLKKLTRRPELPFLEAQTAAGYIAELFKGKKLFLCLSGGLDSESMAYAFLAAKIPFTAATFKMKNGLNSEETFFAERFCRNNNIERRIFELDCVDFYESGKVFEFGTRYVPVSPEFAAQLWFLESFEEPFVWGGEAFRTFEKNGLPHIQAVSEIEGVYERYLRLSGHPGIANFHFFCSELAWSFFKSSLTFADKTYHLEKSPEAYLQKQSFYRHCGFPISLENSRAQKRHGFEQLKSFLDLKYNNHDYYQSTYRDPFKKRYALNGTSEVHFPKDDSLVSEILHPTNALNETPD